MGYRKMFFCVYMLLNFIFSLKVRDSVVSYTHALCQLFFCIYSNVVLKRKIMECCPKNFILLFFIFHTHFK